MRKFDLQLFWTPHVDAGTYEVEPINVTTQTTTGEDMSPTMKTFYGTSLLENSREKMVFTQIGKKEPFHGKTIEWRKWNTFPKAMTPLTEGVIPTGQKFGMTAITAQTTQHGDYTAISDRLELEAYDDVIFGATEEMGAAEGETYDTLTRNILVAGNSVAYAPTVGGGGTKTPVSKRDALDATAVLDPELVAKVATWLKKSKAPTFSGNTYVMVIHPSQAFDLRNSSEWKEFHKYADVAPIFNGEIGTLHGIRFIESNNVKIYKGAPLTAASATLSVKTAITTGTTTVAVKEAISAAEATALAGRPILLGTVEATIASATAGAAGSASLTTTANVENIGANTVIYAGEGGAGNAAVYCSLAFGKDAFGVLAPEGEGMELIIKDRGTIGGPLNQFSTVGYKFNHGAKILYQERMLRVETGSSYSAIDEAN